MPIRIRLARHGRKNTPYYHIVAISSGKARDALPLEKLGEYDPIPRVPNISVIPSGAKVFGKGQVHMPTEKKISWNVDRIRHWLGVGAEPSRRVVRLLERVSFWVLLTSVGTKLIAVGRRPDNTT